MELEVMEAEETEEIAGSESGLKSWEVKVGSGGAFAKFVEGDRSPDEEVEERSRWGLALVSKTVSFFSFSFRSARRVSCFRSLGFRC